MTLSGPAAAAAAGNDDFEGAELIAGLPWNTTADTTEATVQSGEPEPSCGWAVGATVWYRLEPSPTSRVVALSTAGSAFDTVLAVWQGSALDSLSQVGCSDDASGLQSALTLAAKAGSTYYVQVGGYGGESGALSLSANESHSATNDHRADATVIPSLPYEESIEVSGSTIEADEPIPCGGYAEDIAQTVWYRYTPTERLAFVAATAEHSYIALWEEHDDGALTEVACNHEGWDYDLVAGVSPGSSYLVQIGFHEWETEPQLSVRFEGIVPPANDDLADAHRLTGVGDVVEQSTLGATLEADEPDPGCGYEVSNTVWFRWIPEADDAVVVSTSGSSFDTVVAVYADEIGEGPVTISGDGGMVRASCNDESPGFGSTSSAGFVAQAGHTYWIQVGGYFGGSGDLTLRLLRGVSAGEPGVKVATDGGDHHEVGGGGYGVVTYSGAEVLLDDDRHVAGAVVAAPFVFGGAVIDRSSDGGIVTACGAVVLGTCFSTGTP